MPVSLLLIMTKIKQITDSVGTERHNDVGGMVLVSLSITLKWVCYFIVFIILLI